MLLMTLPLDKFIKIFLSPGFFHEIGTPEYDRLIDNDKRLPGSRAIIGLDVHKVGTVRSLQGYLASFSNIIFYNQTCGYAVPYYKFISHRTQLMTWAARKEANDQRSQPEIDDSLAQASSSFAATDEPISINPNGMKQWWKSHNLMSLDGLPGFSMTLGRGFSFGIEINVAKNKVTRGEVPGNPSDTSWQTTFTKIQSPFHVRGMYHWRSFHYQDLLSLLHVILPYLLTLVIGISIGRFYDSHHFCS